MEAAEILEHARAKGVSLWAEGGYITARPKGRTSPELAAAIRAHKGELLAHLRAEQEEGEIDRLARADAEQEDATADEALTLLNRLRCYTLPADRMPVVRELAERLTPFARASAPAAMLAVLIAFEDEFIALGGAPDPELADTAAMIERTFPGARLVEVRKLQEAAMAACE